MNVPTSTAAAPSARRSRPLSRERILDGAIALIEQEGSDALSMRRLGSRLGVEAMAIYHYFTSRDDLLGAIADRLLEPLDVLELGDEWREACRRLALTLREVAVTYPATFRLLAFKPLDAPRSLRPVERLMGVLVAHGYSPAHALALYRATISYARGYALAEATGFTVDAAGPAGRSRLAKLSATEFPVLGGRHDELGSLHADEGYWLGLDALLRGWPDPSADGAGR